jgi:hypothetical protein
MIMFIGLPQLILILHLTPYKASSGLIFMMHNAYYCRQDPQCVNNIPTLMIYPSHTCEACLQSLDSLFWSAHLFVDVGITKLHLGTQVFKNILPKIRSKLCIPIRKNCH